MSQKPDRLALLERLLQLALTEQADRRAAFLTNACGDDELLRLEVESLLAQSTGSAGPVTEPSLTITRDVALAEATPGLIGRRIGVYEVCAPLGAGGMGEVYRARDTRLGRDVAIKVLPPRLRDQEHFVRFEREARVLASFSHPHIGAIYGLESGEEGTALVLELVEGMTLAERVRRGAMPLQQTLLVARQIADALEAAHERGIIHRDLKPANIKITPEGVIKVLDFGLAKLDTAWKTADTHGPTIEDTTREGMILGTPAYMSPEQVRGEPLDKRTDIWAYGCVLYEALCGQRAFGGSTVAETLAAVLTREPEWSALPPFTPEQARELLRRCLDRDSKTRLRDIGEARIALSENALAQGSRVQDSTGPRSWPVRIVEVSGTNKAFYPAISPDGLSVAYVKDDALWVRRLDRMAGSAIVSSPNVRSTAWSPAGDALAYFLGSEVRIIRTDGTEGRTVWRPDPRQIFRSEMGLAWHKSSIFVPAWGGILRVPLDGREADFVARWNRDSDVVHFRFPVILDDEQRTIAVNPGLYAGKKDFGTVWIFRDGVGTQVLSFPDSVVLGLSYSFQTRHLLISTEDAERFTLWAASFDPEHMVAGSPRRVLDDVVRPSVPSVDGTLVLVGGVERRAPSLLWIDSQGRQTGSVSNEYVDQRNLALSPDGRYVAAYASSSNDAAPCLWVYDLKRGSETSAAPDCDPWASWSPDSRCLAFTTRGKLRLFKISQTGPAVELAGPTRHGFPAWTADGRAIAFVQVRGTKGSTEIAHVGLDGRAPKRIAQIPDLLGNVSLSPDGRLLAYDSGTKGRTVVTVTTFPDCSIRLQVSRETACLPQWSPGGDEIWFLEGNQFVAVQIEKNPDGHFTVGRSRTLLKASAERPLTWVFRDVIYRQFSTVDGKRFLLRGPHHAGESRITLIENFRNLIQPLQL